MKDCGHGARGPGDGGQGLWDTTIRPRIFPGKAPFRDGHEIEIISGQNEATSPPWKDLSKLFFKKKRNETKEESRRSCNSGSRNDCEGHSGPRAPPKEAVSAGGATQGMKQAADGTSAQSESVLRPEHGCGEGAAEVQPSFAVPECGTSTGGGMVV